ncbi:putative teichuronic acid biosynthesis glycosyltransferase TuaG [Planctomycetes bacterium CA13]|uniref:Putative teichuronic acid biosynthesis glycosyltransferase TuaG n=1 Tax=Novipirellula herctigrandis TaxID=2527986 RepID=A0A5C5Z1Y8_9BACT|nr:putative teichuronic acid biosynthesis glycosyltransferase TuaG [Planctomycetes bacterium CA13]
MPKTLPRITVVTPSYNQGDYLEETIRSVLDQDYPNLQYIVVDGGSTDQSGEILDKYSSQISHVIREPDEGQSDAICKGLELADGDFFNWINSDDLLMPGVLLELGKSSNPAIDLYTYSVSVFGENTESYLMYNRNLSAKAILRSDPYSFSQPGLWFRLPMLRECGGIDRSLNYGFDWDLLIRYLAAHPRVHYSDSVGARFRLHSESKTIVEFAKEDEQANRFLQESHRIRDKLESTLAPQFAEASKLGRLRTPWNDYLTQMLDDRERSPIAAALEILWRAATHPRVGCSRRTIGTIARLLSRYVRPKDSIGTRR